MAVARRDCSVPSRPVLSRWSRLAPAVERRAGKPFRIIAGAWLLALSGCGPTGAGPARVLVATSWPRAERERIAAEFAHWLDAEAIRGPDRPRLEWLPIAADDDRARLASRRNPPEVLLGCPASALDRLERAGRLGSLPFANAPARAVLRDVPSAPTHAKSVLQKKGFRAGLARLVEEAAAGPGSTTDAPETGTSARPEGVALVRKAAQAGLARTFARFLESSGRIAGGPAVSEQAPEPMADALLADLLGATLVDARDELGPAWAAFENAGRPKNVLDALTGPPPWPPASIARMLERDDLELVEALASQIAPAPTARAWLMRSWLAPGRALDQALLDEIARAADHELCREPRFRDWLRAEWTAWARQRYRAARHAASEQGPIPFRKTTS